MTAMAGQQEEVKICLCIHAYKYASIIKYIKKEQNICPGKGRNVWRSIKVE